MLFINFNIENRFISKLIKLLTYLITYHKFVRTPTFHVLKIVILANL